MKPRYCDWRQLCKMWGGYKYLCDDLNIDYKRLEKWLHRDRVPCGFWLDILEAAQRREIALDAYDLLWLGSER